MVPVERVLMDLDIVLAHAEGPEQRPHLFLRREVRLGLAGLERQFPAVIAAGERDIHHRPVLVGPEGQQIAVRPPPLDAAVDNDPHHVERVPQQLHADVAASRTAPAVAADHIAHTRARRFARRRVLCRYRDARCILLQRDHLQAIAHVNTRLLGGAFAQCGLHGGLVNVEEARLDAQR